jgi:ATP synthase protein I
MNDEPLSEAARLRAERERRGEREGEPSLGRRLGQIGVLGWLIVTPALGGLFLGRWIDRAWHTGIFFSAPLLLVGLLIGGWLGWRWVEKS